MWGHQNHTVLELFMLLSRMHHYQAMTKIKKFVDSDYHRLIQEGEQNPELLMRQLELDDNCVKKSAKILNVPRAVVVSREDNESVPVRQPKPPKSPLVRRVLFACCRYFNVR